MSDLPTPHFSGSRSELEALEEWIDKFTCAFTSPASDESGEVTYLVDLRKLNRVLATAHDYFGCLDPASAQECSELVQSLLRDVTAMWVPGDGIPGSDIDEQAYRRCQRQLKRTNSYFLRLGTRIREELKATITTGNRSEKHAPVPAPIKRPPENALKAWRLRELLGITNQTEIAQKLSEEGISATQGQVSRWLKLAEEYLEAGNVLPLNQPMTKKPQSLDPSIIEMGKRRDNRTPRQRGRRDADSRQ